MTVFVAVLLRWTARTSNEAWRADLTEASRCDELLAAADVFNWQRICRRCRSLADDDPSCSTRANVLHNRCRRSWRPSSPAATGVNRVGRAPSPRRSQPGRGGRAIAAKRLLGLGDRTESQRLTDLAGAGISISSSSIREQQLLRATSTAMRRSSATDALNASQSWPRFSTQPSFPAVALLWKWSNYNLNIK